MTTDERSSAAVDFVRSERERLFEIGDAAIARAAAVGESHRVRDPGDRRLDLIDIGLCEGHADLRATKGTILSIKPDEESLTIKLGDAPALLAIGIGFSVCQSVAFEFARLDALNVLGAARYYTAADFVNLALNGAPFSVGMLILPGALTGLLWSWITRAGHYSDRVIFTAAAVLFPIVIALYVIAFIRDSWFPFYVISFASSVVTWLVAGLPILTSLTRQIFLFGSLVFFAFGVDAIIGDFIGRSQSTCPTAISIASDKGKVVNGMLISIVGLGVIVRPWDEPVSAVLVPITSSIVTWKTC